MAKELYEMIKRDLEEAIKNKDYQKIAELKTILEMTKVEDDEKIITGIPSIDKVWLKHYKENAFEDANNIPRDKTVWEVLEDKLIEYYDIPAINYFGREITREDFIENVYRWARTLKAMGIEKEEIVPIYGPFFPEICAITCALNVIGATGYFIKLDISPKALIEETQESKVAIVYDKMWNNVKHEFTKDKWKKVLIASATKDMPSPKKEIVSFFDKIEAMKNKSSIPREDKYVWLDDVKRISDYYTGEVKEKFEPNRSAYITASSGTTVGGVVKGTIATNESVIAQMYMGKFSEVKYYPGERCLTNFPPTASTSLSAEFYLPLFSGMTLFVDPRVSAKDFYNQLINIKPSIALNSDSMWNMFFTRVEKEMREGKKFDFSCAKGWTIGAEGSSKKRIARWNKIMEKANAPFEIFMGYGLSENFSTVTVKKAGIERTAKEKEISEVGIPYAGVTVGVFDKDGHELSYNERGELWAKSNAMMKGYYKKPELTKETIVDGWLHTGDIAEIDEDGVVYVWGREKDSIELKDNKKLYLFDVSHQLIQNNYIEDAVVLPMPTDKDNTLVAHIVWNEEVKDINKPLYLEALNMKLKEFLPEEVSVVAYSEHDGMIPFNPATVKKDKNKLSIQTSGYIQVADGEIQNVEFIPSENNKYDIKYTKQEIDTKQKNKVYLKK